MGANSASAQPNVVVSIAPAHSLITGVMDGIGKPTLLIKGGASPHTYALRPSDASALEQADVIFWIGETLESFLTKPLAALSGRARVIELMEVPDVHLLRPVSEEHHEAGDDDEGHEDGDTDKDDDEHADEHDHGHGEHAFDPHIWLAPENAVAIVKAGVAALEAADPENAMTYRANGERMIARIVTQEADLRQSLAPVASGKFIVFHDAYRYFEEAFGIHSVGSITVGSGRMPGARRLSELREKIEHFGATCIFQEPQFTPKLAEAIIEGTDARLGVLDPLGAGLPPGESLYFDLMRKNAEALTSCLSGKPAG